MFLEPHDHGGEPLTCRLCERPIYGEDVDGCHPHHAATYKSLMRALDMLGRAWG